jgi:hypothetical protein
MAERDIVGGMFGITPESYQQGMARRDTATNAQLAQLAPGQLAGFYAMEAGTGLGRATQGLLGVEDPELMKIRDVQQMRTQFDVSTPAGLNQFAQALGQKGYTDLAMQASTRAAELQETMAKTGKAQAEGLSAQTKLMNEVQLRQDLAALGPNATQEQILAVVSRYGSPDAVLRTLQASQDRQALIASREGMAAEKAAEKKSEKEAKLSQNQEMAIGAVDRVINEVKEAKPMVGKLTAGFGGSALSVIPGTEARDLQAKLTTIKANLGFDRLQQMRDASPTGGALGQVAVQELVALQSTVASLDAGQSPKQLREALDKIERHYSKWRETVRKAGGQGQENTGTQGNVVDFNSLPTGRK